MGDPPAQGWPAEGFGVAERPVAEGALGRFEHAFGRPASGLADFHMHDVMAGSGARVRGGQHVHRQERIDTGSSANFASIRDFSCL